MSQGDPPKDRAMRKLAAALGYVALVNNNRLTLSALADGVVGQASNLRGRPRVQRLAEFLLSHEPAGATDFDKACRQLESSRIGSGLMIVISDFLFKEGYESGLRRLSTPRYDLYAIQVLSPQELKPELSGDLRLLDVEDGQAAEVTVSAALLRSYQRQLSTWCNGLKDLCTKRGGQYILASSSDPVEAIVLTHLRRRGLLT
jgi:uncharacterized protein (DUF58 family)